MIKPFYYVCKVDENNWEVCYDNGFGETIEGKFKTEQQAKDAARGLNMTKEEIKTWWLEELRSGKHHQITGTLKDQFGNGEYGYCCLGVLAEKVMGMEVPIADEAIPYDEGNTGIYEKISNTIGQHFSNWCSRKNDTGWAFPEIADYIEHNWNPDAEETVE